MLIIPFIVQVVTVVSLVGYFSYQNGQSSIEELTNQLISSTSKRIEQQLISYLRTPRFANQMNSDAVARGEVTLDLDRSNPQTEQYLWQQMQLFPNLTWLSLGTERGDYLGAWRPKQQPVQIAIANASTRSFVTYYATNNRGRRTDRLKVETPAYDPRTRPWYRAAIRGRTGSDRKTAVWTPIYSGFTPGTVFIAASQPLYDAAGTLMGVSSADLSLLGIQTFLAQTPVSPNGRIFLIERSGLLVATSTQEPLFQRVAGERPERISVSKSQTPLIQATGQFLQQSGGLQSIDRPRSFRFKFGHEWEIVQVLPFDQPRGLDWLIVIVLPKSDVMERFETGTRMTILLCLAALAAVIALNTIISRWLVQPLIDLNQASARIAQGDFSNPVRPASIWEFSILADSFNRMSQEIQQSRSQLEDYSRSLEEKIGNRTEALRQEIRQRMAVETALQAANQELQNLAYLDGLTQIANRRRFDERLKQEWRNMRRSQLPLSLILCDVDYFKQYNDAYGHQAGDDCLRQVAKVISQAIRRPSDIAARYGGEEFAVLLPSTTLEGATNVANLMQTQIKSLQMPHCQSQVSQYLTVSFGVACLIPSEDCSPEQLLQEVDRALYQAKIAGRDRVQSLQT